VYILGNEFQFFGVVFYEISFAIRRFLYHLSLPYSFLFYHRWKYLARRTFPRHCRLPLLKPVFPHLSLLTMGTALVGCDLTATRRAPFPWQAWIDYGVGAGQMSNSGVRSEASSIPQFQLVLWYSTAAAITELCTTIPAIQHPTPSSTSPQLVARFSRPHSRNMIRRQPAMEPGSVPVAPKVSTYSNHNSLPSFSHPAGFIHRRR